MDGKRSERFGPRCAKYLSKVDQSNMKYESQFYLLEKKTSDSAGGHTHPPRLAHTTHARSNVGPSRRIVAPRRNPAMPGFRQRAARQTAEAADALNSQLDSALASFLLQPCSWGHLSAAIVQKTAYAAKQDGLKHKDVDLLVRLGTSGRHECNTHRKLLKQVTAPVLFLQPRTAACRW